MSKQIEKSKGHRLARLGVVLCVILASSAFGMALSSAADTPPGQNQCDPSGHGGNEACDEDPNENGQDCEEHGNGGVNEDHCLSEDGTVDDGTTDDGTADDGTTDDGTTDDGTTDDGTVDDGTVDDGNTDDGTVDDGTVDDGNVDDGNVDDGSTDDGSTDDGNVDDGNVDDGSTDDGSTDDGTVVEGVTIVKAKPKPEVEGNQLAQTGPETTALTIIGITFLMLGVAMRFARFGANPVMATTDSDALVARSLDMVERMVKRNARWDCRG